MLEIASLLVLAAIVMMARDFPYQFAPAVVTAGGPDFEPPKPERKPWEDLLMFKKGAGSAPAPDPNIGKAAMKEAETGEAWLKFAKDQFAVGNERQKDIDALTKQVTQAQIDSMTDANARADQQWKRYTDVFQPLQDQYIDEAKNWGSADRENQMAAEAKADVMGNAAVAKAQNERQMASLGVNPTSGRFAGVERANDTTTALAAAGAQNQARTQVRTQALALKEGLANMGQGATATSAQQMGLGLNAGQAAVGSTATGQQLWQGNNAIMGQGFQGAMQGYQGQASALNQQYQNQLAGWQAQQQASSANAAGLMSGIGSLVGGGLAFFSSKKLKENKRPVEGSALEALDQMPVEEWKYKDGVADSGEHIGAYAEDFHKATGKGDGKTIPVMDAIGVTMKAVQELNNKVDKALGAKSLRGGIA